VDDVFKALADPSRRVLLDRLFERDGQTLTELCSHLPGMTRFGVMSHVDVLERAGLVTARKVGREKRHYLNPVPIREVADRWMSRYSAPIVGALVSLRRQLEQEVPPMADTPGTAPDHVYVTYIRATADAIWQAITEGDQTVRYYFGTRLETTLEPGSAFRYTYADGSVAADGQILAVEPGRSLAMSFQARWDPQLVAEGPVRMTWLIEPAGPGACKVSVIHEGMGPKTTTEFTGGIAFIVSGLKSVLETGAGLPTG
jgi:DNA-binding transcriptional ArsR family regulator/uncharacterized protein YndB with AHSA1/START domain